MNYLYPIGIMYYTELHPYSPKTEIENWVKWAIGVAVPYMSIVVLNPLIEIKSQFIQLPSEQ